MFTEKVLPTMNIQTQKHLWTVKTHFCTGEISKLLMSQLDIGVYLPKQPSLFSLFICGLSLFQLCDSVW